MCTHDNICTTFFMSLDSFVASNLCACVRSESAQFVCITACTLRECTMLCNKIPCATFILRALLRFYNRNTFNYVISIATPNQDMTSSENKEETTKKKLTATT